MRTDVFTSWNYLLGKVPYLHRGRLLNCQKDIGRRRKRLQLAQQTTERIDLPNCELTLGTIPKRTNQRQLIHVLVLKHATFQLPVTCLPGDM